MRVRDKGGVLFRWILEYWRINDLEGATARRLRFRLSIMIDRFAHVLPSFRSEVRWAVVRVSWRLLRMAYVMLRPAGRIVTKHRVQGRDIADLMFESLTRRVVVSVSADSDKPPARYFHHLPTYLRTRQM